jgi:dihydrofolate synthase/folylpolyglutamate synthase
MRFTTLDAWLAWQDTLHPRAIDLGLDRCRAVVDRLGGAEPGFPLVTVAGTNGKGSTVAYLEAVLTAAGYRTGAYTSPHLVRYNERVRVAGAPVEDGPLCEAFDRIDRARGEVSLSYFEFGTLAAMEVFRRAALDVAVLEVGLGGRLDAVNVFDADVAVVTTIDLDHQEWLGPDRESIGREKAGILRPGRPAVCGDPDPPASLLAAAARLGAPLWLAGREFRAVAGARDWTWQAGRRAETGLPLPALPGAFQLGNAATALTALECLAPRVTIPRPAIERGVATAWLPGRLQVIPGPPERVLDVAHNPQAARALAAFLRARPCPGRTHALVGMLADKDLAGYVAGLAPAVDCWHVVTLGGPRGASAERLAGVLAGAGLGDRVALYPEVTRAYRALLAQLTWRDRIVVSGSFHTVGPILALESAAAGRETRAP